MDIDLFKLFITQIPELMWNVCRDHNDLPGTRIQRDRADREGRLPLLYDKDLFVGMLV